MQVEKRRISAAVSTHENFINDVYYIAFQYVIYIIRRQTNAATAQRCMEILLSTFKIVSVDQEIIARATAAKGRDFEDSIQFYSALASRTNYLLTRNPQDFPRLPLSILSPEEFLHGHAGLRQSDD